MLVDTKLLEFDVFLFINGLGYISDIIAENMKGYSHKILVA